MFKGSLTYLVLAIFSILCACEKSKDPTSQIPTLTEAKPVDPKVLSQSRMGQTVYVPIYSHLPYTGSKKILPMRAVLSVRNVSEKYSLIVSRVDYYDTNGKLLKRHIVTPLSLGPLVSYDLEIPSLDLSGGTGANFIVRWDSTQKMTEPVIEALMYGSAVHQSYSFLSVGKVINDDE